MLESEFIQLQPDGGQDVSDRPENPSSITPDGASRNDAPPPDDGSGQGTAPPPSPGPEKPPFFFRKWPRIALYSAMGIYAVILLVGGFFYFKYAHTIDQRLSGGPFSGSVDIFSAPRTVGVGDEVSAAQMTAELRRSGYSESRTNPVGYFNAPTGAGRRIDIYPGRNSFAGGEAAMLEFSDGHISRIVSLADNTPRQTISLGPQLIANLSNSGEKRRMEQFTDIPPNLVHAVISAEDKHFFHHTGFDGLRILKAAYVDMRTGRKEQGASTLTMQLARGFFLESDKRWRRKIAEMLIAWRLEHKLTKQQIFEYYANQVYLGRTGPFSIHGFGEGARVFLAKDLSQINVAEAAMLAGLVQRPSYFNPQRYPDRARERRDIVLGLMRENHYLTDSEYDAAIAQPVKIAAPTVTRNQDQYFVDEMNNELQTRFDDHDRQARYIYTTFDPDLQRFAEQAVTLGMENVDRQLKAQKKQGHIPEGEPQVALVAIDPHSGEIKALVGGRDYSASQLNHALAMRQPGSVFKPFVYAAALDTAIEGGSQILTAATILNDQPTTFAYDRGKTYQPSNFKHEFMGDVTLRTALAHSLNVATVSLAQQVGLDRVVAMAHRAGLNNGIKATPAVALGAYETTPIEIAGAYTLFANQGMRVAPTAISLVRGGDGTPLYEHRTDAVPELDPRVSYLMVNLLEEVLRSGTGAAVQSYRLNMPAAGKTGTSRDGWFAGFTTDLLCVVWVGFDDNRELNLEGAHSALPIWAEFMKRAASLRQYKSARQFPEPGGLVSEKICADSGKIAGEYCPRARNEMFIDGTEPAEQCPLHTLPVSSADRIDDGLPQATPAAIQPVHPLNTPQPPPTAPIPPSRSESTPYTTNSRSTPPAVAPPMAPPVNAAPARTPNPATAPPPTAPPQPPLPATGPRKTEGGRGGA
jgi:penicillin-binding protein 1B